MDTQTPDLQAVVERQCRQLVERLEKVEKQNGRLKRWGVLVVVVLGVLTLVGFRMDIVKWCRVGPKTPSMAVTEAPEFIKARNLSIVNRSGEKVAHLNESGLWFYDKRGKQRAHYTDSSLGFIDEKGVNRVTLSYSDFEQNETRFSSEELSLSGGPGKPSATLGRALGEAYLSLEERSLSTEELLESLKEPSKASKGASTRVSWRGVTVEAKGTQSTAFLEPERLRFLDESKVCIALTNTDKGPFLFLYGEGEKLGPALGLTDFHITDEDGNIRVWLGINEDGSPFLKLCDADGTGRASLGATQLVTPRTGASRTTAPSSLVLFDKEGTVIWRAPQ